MLIRLIVVLVGDSGVGKTTLVSTFVKEKPDLEITSTVCIEMRVHEVELINSSYVKLEIWDSAGCEKYRSVAKNHYKNALGALIVYNITQRESFTNVDNWLKLIRENCPEDAVIYLIGNKLNRNDILGEGRP
uniref:Ras-related protein RABA1b-like n=1 Tax=Dermatophagoides pteronyssinus TaxID=6956 RepID=A0A6P6XL05_DERPT|nr:ras-related protein RABA1b-like [Dermatophagoides pteronyssinus]